MSEFVSLASYVRAALRREPEPELDSERAPCDAEPEADGTVPEAPVDVEEAIAEARRFRAALADALDVAVSDMLEDVAADVLARELRLAPSDVGAIVAQALERNRDAGPVRVRVRPLDVPQLDGCGLPVVADATLRGGDVVLEVRAGTIDVSLGVRLAAVLASVAR